MRLKTRALFSLNIRVYAPGGGGCLSALGAWELPGSVPEHNTRMQRLEAAKTKSPADACVDRRLRCTCPFGRSACAETACDWAASLSRSCWDGTHGLSRGWARTLSDASQGQAQHACARPTRVGRGSRRRTMTCGVMELRIDCPLRSPRRRRCVCQHAGEHGERPVSPLNQNNTGSGCQDHELFHAPYPFCPSFLPCLLFCTVSRCDLQASDEQHQVLAPVSHRTTN